MEITNGMIAKATWATHPQAKQWGAYFLGSDPHAGQSSGKPRSYSFDQACKVYLGGYLTAKLGFKRQEARTILNDLWTWLESKGWIPSKYIVIRPTRTRAGCQFLGAFPGLIVRIVTPGTGEFVYRVDEILAAYQKQDPEDEQSDIHGVEYRPHWFPEEKIGLFYKERESATRTFELHNVFNNLGHQLCKVA